MRLLREAGMDVANVAVTQGSKKDRQEARLRELEKACDYLGYRVLVTAAEGMPGIATRRRESRGIHPRSRCEAATG